MKLDALKTALASNIKDDALSLTAKPAGLSWDLGALIGAQFQIETLSLTAAGLSVQDAPIGSVMVEGKNQPAVFLKGTPSAAILGIDKGKIANLWLFAVPTAPNDPNDTGAEVCLVVELYTGWTVADSFPTLGKTILFGGVVATKPPFILLTSFEHDQSWEGANTANGLTQGMNLQVSTSVLSELYPPLAGLFGDIDELVFDLLGNVDNSQSVKDPNNVSAFLVAPMGTAFAKTLSANGAINVEFDICMQAVYTVPLPNPAYDDPDSGSALLVDSDPPQGLLAANLVLQATFGKILLRTVVPAVGNLINFSMTGLKNQPVLSLDDIAQLFDPNFLSETTPETLQQVLEHLGIMNLGMTLLLPSSDGSSSSGSGGVSIAGALLEVGYNGPPIGYPMGVGDWISLQALSITWSVIDPFGDSPEPSIAVSGDVEFLEGILSVEGNFYKADNADDDSSSSSSSSSGEPGKHWTFDLQGALEGPSEDGSSSSGGHPNVIRLSKIFDKFESESGNMHFPEIDIDELSFEAKPEQSYYSLSIKVDIGWGFSGFAYPALDSLSLTVTKDEDGYTGELDTRIHIGHASSSSQSDEDGDGNDPGLVGIELIAQRTADSWIFEGKNAAPFTMADLLEAFGLNDAPAYLHEIEIDNVDVKYTAPINKGSSSSSSSGAELLEEDSAGKKIEITVEAKFPIVEEELDVTLLFVSETDKWSLDGTIYLEPVASGSSSSSGLNPGQQEFTFSVARSKTEGNSSSSGSTDTLLSVNWKDLGRPLNISDFALALGLEPPSLPDALNDIGLTEAGFTYETDTAKGKSFMFTAASAEYGNLVFAVVKTDTGWKLFFGLAFKPTLNFGKLPVVGSAIDQFGGLSLDQIIIVALTKPLSKNDASLLHIPEGYPQLPKMEGDTVPAELIFNGELNIVSSHKPLNLVIKLGSDNNSSSSSAALKSGGGDDQTPVNNAPQKVGKAFGPVQINKFNIGYTDGAISLDVDGSLTLASVAMSFQQMGIRMKFPPKSIQDVSFELRGLGVNVQQPGFQLAGGFITLDDKFDNFMGMVTVQAGPLGLQAYGGLSTTTPSPSFFIFLHLMMPIGGPPFFFVTGLSGGFGINRRFILPTFDQLATYPLLPSAPSNPIPVGPPSGIGDITGILTELAQYIPPQEGAYWIAAGLDFTSFELIKISAILEVGFGAGFQIGLIGNGSISIPEPEEPIAFLSINFEVVFDTNEGLLAVAAVVTPASFLFSKSCRLTGGFAFYTWFAGEHEGDFVVTLGGYHPMYRKPDWYPSVPRLGLSWEIGPLHLTGQSYFALTPHMLMAGIDIIAVFDIKVVKATFNLGADFLLGWKPFFYLVDAYINISIELHLLFTFHFSVGVDVTLWGPPFGGKCHVHLSIFSFTIHFGSSGPVVPPLTWEEFKLLLPNSYPQKEVSVPLGRRARLAAQPLKANDSKNYSTANANVTKGLIQLITPDPLPDADIYDGKKFNWVIDPNDFEIVVKSAAPSNNFIFNNIEANANKADYEPVMGPGAYLLPGDIEAFYTNPNSGNINSDTLVAYDYTQSPRWWEQQINVGPMDLTDGSFRSTFQVLIDGINGSLSPEDNFVVYLQSGNVPASLWGNQVTPANGNAVLNQPSTIQNALTGMLFAPKIWNPLKTRDINIYELLFQGGHNLCWPPEVPPVIGPNKFDESYSDDGDTMTFEGQGSAGTITSKFRQLNEKAFANLPTGADLVVTIAVSYGLNVAVSTNAGELAEPMYKDWPIVCLLGESGKNAQNRNN